jgi:hypothetical protein
MTCADVEILICDYLDGALSSEQRAEVERHLGECHACSELARDAGAAIAFMERAADVEPPPELVTRILYQIPSGRRTPAADVGRLRSWLGHLLEPVLQPKLVMSMALTILSFSMMLRCSGVSSRQLRPTDLNPTRVWASVEDKAQRTWDRTVKFYENIRFVYEIQSRLREWTEQEQEAEKTEAPRNESDERRLPVTETGNSPGEEKNR